MGNFPPYDRHESSRNITCQLDTALKYPPNAEKISPTAQRLQWRDWSRKVAHALQRQVSDATKTLRYPRVRPRRRSHPWRWTLYSGIWNNDQGWIGSEGGRVLGCVVGLVESHDQRIHPVKLRGHPRIDTEWVAHRTCTCRNEHVRYLFGEGFPTHFPLFPLPPSLRG
jgi:hypothetical protein